MLLFRCEIFQDYQYAGIHIQENIVSLKEKRADIVYEQLRNHILSLDIDCDDPLTEEALATELKTSRTPIREAFRRLESEHMIEIVPYRGAFVKKLTLKDISEIFVIRKALEPVCAKTACAIIGPTDLIKIEESLDIADALLASDQIVASSLVGDSIHENLIKIANNSRILQIFSSLSLQLARLKKISTVVPELTAKSNIAHRDILSALKNKNAEGAADSMLEHLEHTEQMMKSIFNNSVL